MKKKIFTLLTLAILAVGSAWADEAVLSWNMGANGAAATGANSITGASGCAAEGFTIAITGNTDKSWSSGNGDITYSGTTYKTLKNSNGAKNTITCPTGKVATKIVFYAVTNDASTKGKLSEFDGTSCNDEVSSLKDYTNFTTIEKNIDNKSSFTFTFSTKQVCFIAVVTYETPDSRTKATLSFPQSAYNVMFGNSFTAPSLSVDPAAASNEVAYSSSNTGVATVDASTGAVTLVAPGETTITAAISSSETYRDASASYTLTVTDPNAINVSATWTMADGADSKGVAGADETVMKMSWGMASNIKLHATATATYGGTKVTQFVPIAKANDSERVNTNYVEFSMTPWKGLTFTPTSVSFEAFKVGTDGPKIDVDFIDGAGNTIKLETNAAITRNNKVGESGQANQVHSHTLTTAAASANAVKLRIYIRNCAADKNVAFGHIVISGKASGTAEALASYIVTTSMNIDGAGIISPLLGDNSVYEGNDIQLKATANTGFEFINWTIDGATQTANPYTISDINENHTAVANFKQLLSITYAAGEGEGEVPATAYTNEGATYTVAKSFFLKKDGYSLTGWTDGTNTYTTGETFTMPSTNVTLTPVFAENTESLAKTLSKTTVKWDFQQKNIGLFTSATSGWFVAQAIINSKNIDVPMAFNKQIPNANWQDWANTGNKPTLTIPAVKGMKITMLTYSSPSTTTIAGATDYTVTGSSNPYTVTYTYEGSDATIDIVLNDADYIRTLTVEYPKTHTYLDVTSVGYRTFASSSALDFTGGVEGLTAYRATVDNKVVSFTAIDGSVPAGEGMLIKAAEGRYYIPVATSTPAAIENEFIGVTSATEVPAGSFVLMAGTATNQGTGFYKTTNTFTVGANTAYLPADVAAARNFIGFNEDETTGIDNLNMNDNDNENLNTVFDLQGRRVAQPQKGLYIMNGKKVIIK